MEEQIIKSLDFSLRDVSSIQFLERFLRLFGIDQEKKKSSISQMRKLSYEFCSYMSGEAEFLDYRPS